MWTPASRTGGRFNASSRPLARDGRSYPSAGSVQPAQREDRSTTRLHPRAAMPWGGHQARLNVASLTGAPVAARRPPEPAVSLHPARCSRCSPSRPRPSCCGSRSTYVRLGIRWPARSRRAGRVIAALVRKRPAMRRRRIIIGEYTGGSRVALLRQAMTPGHACDTRWRRRCTRQRRSERLRRLERLLMNGGFRDDRDSRRGHQASAMTTYYHLD